MEARPNESCAQLTEILTAYGLSSEMAAEIWMSAVPLLPGASQLFREGLQSTIAEANRRVEEEMELEGAHPALFDPQTCGGLLAAVAEESASELVARLKQEGVSAAIVGRVGCWLPDTRLRVTMQEPSPPTAARSPTLQSSSASRP